jgi:hypothetical protein
LNKNHSQYERDNLDFSRVGSSIGSMRPRGDKGVRHFLAIRIDFAPCRERSDPLSAIGLGSVIGGVIETNELPLPKFRCADTWRNKTHGFVTPRQTASSSDTGVLDRRFAREKDFLSRPVTRWPFLWRLRKPVAHRDGT